MKYLKARIRRVSLTPKTRIGAQSATYAAIQGELLGKTKVSFNSFIHEVNVTIVVLRTYPFNTCQEFLKS
jgi:hypothetical protein